MKFVLQKVSQASVVVDGSPIGSIQEGYLLFLGVMQGDTAEQGQWIAEKISKLRLFDGEDGKINDRSLLDVQGSILLVSQFTLAGNVQKGNRPDYTAAADPKTAKELYEKFIDQLKSVGIQNVQTGEFGAMMQVSLTNEGPVTLCIER